MEKCAMIVMKSGKIKTADGKNDQIRKALERLGRKKNCKYWAILEANIIKQAEIKKNIIKKKTSEEGESFSKPNSVAEITSKWQLSRQFPFEDTQYHS